MNCKLLSLLSMDTDNYIYLRDGRNEQLLGSNFNKVLRQFKILHSKFTALFLANMSLSLQRTTFFIS